MYGKNRILKEDKSADGSLLVHSVFKTIQGEGPFAGRSAIFIRLYGCSLACSWCDTEFELSKRQIAPPELLKQVNDFTDYSHKPLIVFTGGEPMRQRLAPACFALLSVGYQVQVETAGIHWDEEMPLPSQVSVVCSPKLSYVHPEIEARAHMKYILSAKDPLAEDGLPLYAVSQRGQKATGKLFRPGWIAEFPHRVYVQPLDEGSEHEKLNMQACAATAMKFGYCLSLQTHKLLNLP